MNRIMWQDPAKLQKINFIFGSSSSSTGTVSAEVYRRGNVERPWTLFFTANEDAIALEDTQRKLLSFQQLSSEQKVAILDSITN